MSNALASPPVLRVERRSLASELTSMQRDLTSTWMPEARRRPLASRIRACGTGAFDGPPEGEV